MRRALFWTLMPLALPQAIAVRRNAPRFAGAAGPRQGVVGAGEPLRLLAIGDSIVAGVGAETTDRALAGAVAASLADRLPREVHWWMTGKIGAGVREARSRLLPQAPEQDFDAVIVSIGVNDITGLRRSRSWADELGDFLDALRARYPRATIAMAGMPPLQVFPLLPYPLRAILGMRGRTFDALASRVVASRANMVFVPLIFDPAPGRFSADGFHPSRESYAELGAGAADRLLAAWSVTAGRSLDIASPSGDNRLRISTFQDVSRR